MSRRTNHGSTFIQALCDEMEGEKKYQMDLCTLLTWVSRRVAEKPVKTRYIGIKKIGAGKLLVRDLSTKEDRRAEGEKLRTDEKYQLPCYTSMLTKTLQFKEPTNALHDITFLPAGTEQLYK